MTKTGAVIARDALRELGVIDAVQAAASEDQAHAINVANDMLDSWRTEGLTIRGVTRSVYNLTASTGSYTIGSGGDFNQDYPTEIVKWSVIPDDDATDPVELSRGRPMTFDEWQQVRVKSYESSYPNFMWWDRSYASGLGNCLFYPIPDNSDIDVVLYTRVPDITSIVAATSYDLAPAYHRALKWNLAKELIPSMGVPAQDFALIMQFADESFGTLRRFGVIPRAAAMRPEFAIGTHRGRRNFNVYNGS